VKFENVLLTLTECGMLLYWVFALLVVLEVISIPPEYMYSDYQNPLVVAWNWSFFPIDVLFSIAGLVGRFGGLTAGRRAMLSVFSLALMFCAGLMAISFWTLTGEFDVFWWGVNIWLVVLSSAVLVWRLRAPVA